ncbi:MAG: phosphotransferase [Lachnospiraceae bacterium]|nr:phosphotransferase [Lachnospiraceae bacterium]
METIKLIESTENGVVIGFFKTLNANNASEAEAEIVRIREDNTQGDLVFDFEGLEYISSAGLRVLLRCDKTENKYGRKIKIINVNAGIYDILEDTGFNRMFEVHKVLKQYSVDNLELIGQGANGTVYRIDNENIVKVFQKAAPVETIERERMMAQEALLMGLPTAISYSVVKVDECFGIVFELIDSDTLSHLLSSRPEDYDRYVDQYIRLYKSIHETRVNSDNFPSIKQIYYDAIEECADYYTEEELNKYRELVAAVPETDTLIHGDFHPNNIMVQNDKLTLIDMGDMSRGHIVFDFLATAATQSNLVKLHPEIAEGHTKMPAELIKRTWRRLIDTYFSDKSEEEKNRIEKQIDLFAKLKVGLAPAFARGLPPDFLQVNIDDARETLLPYIDDLINEGIDW